MNGMFQTKNEFGKVSHEYGFQNKVPEMIMIRDYTKRFQQKRSTVRASIQMRKATVIITIEFKAGLQIQIQGPFQVHFQ